jgi:hypothetical protein
MSETTFSCYLGDGKIEELTLPMAEGPHPLEIGDAVNHFLEAYPDRSWRLYPKGLEGGDPLYAHSPSVKGVEIGELAERF